MGAANYTIQRGDNLWNIVKKQYGLTNNRDIANMVNKIAKENDLKNPNLIFAGKDLKLIDAEDTSVFVGPKKPKVTDTPPKAETKATPPEDKGAPEGYYLTEDGIPMRKSSAAREADKNKPSPEAKEEPNKEKAPESGTFDSLLGTLSDFGNSVGNFFKEFVHGRAYKFFLE